MQFAEESHSAAIIFPARFDLPTVKTPRMFWSCGRSIPGWRAVSAATGEEQKRDNYKKSVHHQCRKVASAQPAQVPAKRNSHSQVLTRQSTNDSEKGEMEFPGQKRSQTVRVWNEKTNGRVPKTVIPSVSRGIPLRELKGTSAGSLDCRSG